MFRLLEETRSQNLQIENNLKEKFQEDIRNKEKQIEQFNSQINQFEKQIQLEVFLINHQQLSFFYFSSFRKMNMKNK